MAATASPLLGCSIICCQYNCACWHRRLLHRLWHCGRMEMPFLFSVALFSDRSQLHGIWKVDEGVGSGS